MKKVFVKTKNVKKFITMMHNLQNRAEGVPGMGLVYGEPGLGKSQTINWWALKQNAVLITAKNGMTKRWFLRDLVNELGEVSNAITDNLFNTAVNKFIEKPRMLIVDEVDYLVNTSKTIETIRDIHDMTGIPVLLVGMGSVDKKLKRFRHLFDRITEIYKFEPFDYEDIKEIITSLCEVPVDDEVIKLVSARMNRMRQIVKWITKAEELAKTNGYKTITQKELGI